MSQVTCPKMSETVGTGFAPAAGVSGVLGGALGSVGFSLSPLIYIYPSGTLIASSTATHPNQFVVEDVEPFFYVLFSPAL